MIIYYRAINDESLPEGYKTLIFISNAGVLALFFFSSVFSKSPVLIAAGYRGSLRKQWQHFYLDFIRGRKWHSSLADST